MSGGENPKPSAVFLIFNLVNHLIKAYHIVENIMESQRSTQPTIEQYVRKQPAARTTMSGSSSPPQHSFQRSVDGVTSGGAEAWCRCGSPEQGRVGAGRGDIAASWGLSR